MAKLESLIIDMQLESAELRKGLDEVKKKLDEAGKSAEDAAEKLLTFEKLHDEEWDPSDFIDAGVSNIHDVLAAHQRTDLRLL